MNKLFYLIVGFIMSFPVLSQSKLEIANLANNKTATYQEFIGFLEEMASKHLFINLDTIGNTDAGMPIHLIQIEPRKSSLSKILINNNIHPGESDGIEATIRLLKNYSEEKLNRPAHTQINIIACYNIGGMLNRNSTTRVNQNGPEAYGFRGNARNYDLNRDFVKADTKNAFAFYKIFHLVKPDIFIDNHVSNGADYQYTLTHLFSQHNKLGGPLADYQEKKMIPYITKELNKKGIPSTPYVNVYNAPPNNGFSQYLDTPRYSSGYTSLWHTLSFMIETHMLKNYEERVMATYETLIESINFLDANYQTIKTKRRAQKDYWQKQELYPLHWKIDSTKITNFEFKGYKYTYENSQVTGFKRLKYLNHQPDNFEIDYYNNYKSSKHVKLPKFYLVPQAWERVVERLKANEVELIKLKKDSLIEVTEVKIKDYKTLKHPYEGHYLHYHTKTEENQNKLTFKKGDILVDPKQSAIRYIVEVLEPEATDSFFNWNFFDTILQRKEGFSPYVFEDLAYEILMKNSSLRKEFEILKSKDESFAKDPNAQLNWIYKTAELQEKEYLRYPIFKIY